MKIKRIIKNKLTYRPKGVSIIEAIVLISVFSIAVMSFYSVFAVGSRYILNSKNKLIAISLANERMEFLRNLPYSSIAIVGGIPNGLISPKENIILGNKTFEIITNVYYYDDPEDGIKGESSTSGDIVSTDYKIVKITVSWGGESATEEVKLSSKFVPTGIENNVSGGTFYIYSIDYAGNPVPNVAVNIFNNKISPVVDYNTETDINGSIILNGVPGDENKNYRITMSKPGYETVSTYSLLTAGFIPFDLNSSIITNTLNQKTIIIDLLSKLTINSKDSFGKDLPNVGFNLLGGRRLDDRTVNPGYYTSNQIANTGNNSRFSIEDVSSGKYYFSDFSFSGGDYQFRKLNIGDDLDPGAINLAPGVSLNADMIFMDKNIDSVYILIRDSGTGSAIPGASVKLENVALNYEATLITDNYGYVYFPEDASNLLQNGEIYNILVTADNYQNKSDSIVVNKLTTKEISLIED